MNQFEREGRGNSNKLGIIILAGAALIAIWLLALIFLGGGSEDSGDTGAGGFGETTGEQSTPEDEVTDDDSGSPEEDPPAEGAGQTDQTTEPEPPPPLPGGVEDEPGGHDPLGLGASAADLSDTARQRVELTAADFVLYAYGYSGDDEQEYLSYLNEVVLSPEFYSSPGAEEIRAVRGEIESGGTEGTAVLDEFEIAQEGEQEVRGVAYFTLGDSFGDEGELSGETRSYGQPLNLVAWGEGYKVQAADSREEIEQ